LLLEKGLASDLVKVLTEENFVDVSIKAGDTRNTIKAHKIIINARLKVSFPFFPLLSG